MSKKQRIELYLDSQKVVLKSKNPYYESNTGKAYTTMAHPRHDDLYRVNEGIFGLTNKEKLFMVQLEQFDSKNHMELKVYDINYFWDSVRGYFKGIEETPIVIINNKRYSRENIDMDKLKINKDTYESTMDTDRFRNGLLLIAAGGAFGLLAIILYSSGLFCFGAIMSIGLIIVGALVSFGGILDRIYDWAN